MTDMYTTDMTTEDRTPDVMKNMTPEDMKNMTTDMTMGMPEGRTWQDMGLTWQRITHTDDPLFAAAWPLYVEAFPEFERRPRHAYAKSLADPRFYANVLCRESKVCALVWYWKVNTSSPLRYVEYLCIAESERGSGLGTTLLKAFIAADAAPLVLEIEELVDEATERRWCFYERLGFTLHKEICIPPQYMIGHQSYRVHLLTSSPDFPASLRTAFLTTLRSEIIITASPV